MKPEPNLFYLAIFTETHPDRETKVLGLFTSLKLAYDAALLHKRISNKGWYEFWECQPDGYLLEVDDLGDLSGL